MDPNDPADLDPLLRNAPGPDDEPPAADQDSERFTVRSEWSMVRVSRKRWFGR